MKKSSLFMAAAIALIFASCENLTNTTIDENNLYGYWQEDEPGSQDYMRFLKASEDTVDGEYKYGYEWDEGDQVYEADVVAQYHGNGWFKWKVRQTNMDMIELMNNGKEFPKVYIIKKLTADELQLQDPDDKSDIDYYHKVVRTK